MGDVREAFNYWIDLADKELNCFSDKTRVEQLFNFLIEYDQLMYYELEDRKGVIAYSKTDDFLGGYVLAEVFMYIKPEYRGNIRLFKELVTHMETKAKEMGLNKVKIASNIGYNDNVVLKVLQRWGYTPDVLVKGI